MLNCQIENHDESQILGCCIKQNCQHLRPYCQYCMIQNHSDHLQWLRSIKELNEWISQKMKSYDLLMNLIQSLRISINTIYEIASLLYIEQLNSREQISYSQLNQLIINVMKIELLEGSEGLIVKIKELNESVINISCKFKNLKSIPIQQSNIVEQALQNNQNNIKNSIKLQLEKSDYQTAQKLPILFSYNFKHKLIELENNGKKAINSSIGWRIALCEPQITNSSSFPIYFSFTIINASASDIGVCYQDKIIKSKYQPDIVQNQAHGVYLINQQGYVYSHLNKSINNTKQSFTFKNRDIIQVEINKEKQIIIWTNQTTNEQYWMQFVLTEIICPCVGINYGEIITINP